MPTSATRGHNCSEILSLNWGRALLSDRFFCTHRALAVHAKRGEALGFHVAYDGVRFCYCITFIEQSERDQKASGAGTRRIAGCTGLSETGESLHLVSCQSDFNPVVPGNPIATIL